MSLYSEDEINEAIEYLNLATKEFHRGSYSDERYCLSKAIEKIQDAIELTMKEQMWQTDRS